MTHDELQSLLVELVDDLEQLKRSQQYIELALEQLDYADNKFKVRVELLLCTYRSVADCKIEDLTFGVKKLKRAGLKKMCTLIVPDVMPEKLQ